MTKKNDWRLQGQEKYLKGVPLFFKKYCTVRPAWEHDHCEFCSVKFSEKKEPGTVQEGYTTKDHYRWICKQCFDNFWELFKWELK